MTVVPLSSKASPGSEELVELIDTTAATAEAAEMPTYINIFYTWRGKTQCATLAATDAVYTLKAVIHNRIFQAPEEFTLRFDGQALEDSHFLAEYNILNGSHVNLIAGDPEMIGGGKTKKVALKSKPVVIHVKPFTVPLAKLELAGAKLLEIQNLVPASMTVQSIFDKMTLQSLEEFAKELKSGKAHVDVKLLGMHKYTGVGKPIVEAQDAFAEALTRLSGIYYEAITREFADMEQLMEVINQEIGKKKGSGADASMQG